jgi:hypothetical protein
MSYDENRVLVKVYGSLPATSPLLVAVPTTPGHPTQRLHTLAAKALARMSAVAQAELGFPLLIASGHRPHRWTSYEEYTKTLVAKYGSLQRGRAFLAFDSPHETGLAMDFGCGGLEPRSATIVRQQQTPLWKWLVANAWRYNITPYKVEPWHWEHHVPLSDYSTGVSTGVPDVSPKLPCDGGLCIEAPLDEN